MGAVNFITLAISVIALLFVLIAHSTPEWTIYEYDYKPAITSNDDCIREVTGTFSLFRQGWEAKQKPNGGGDSPFCASGTFEDDYLNRCGGNDDYPIDVCSWYQNAIGGAGAAIAFGVVLVIAQILLIVFEFQGKTKAASLSWTASFYFFIAVALAALSSASSWKRYHGNYNFRHVNSTIFL
jgi:hypothetical protein